MDPRLFKTVFIVAGLGACPLSPPQPGLYRSLAVVPARGLPLGQEFPEGDHPPHGEGSESPLYLGLGGYTNLNVSNTFSRGVTVDSGVSSSVVSGPWLDNTFPLVAEARDLAQPFQSANPPVASPRVCPDAKGHVASLVVRRRTGNRG
jgi:hypothetical protein